MPSKRGTPITLAPYVYQDDKGIRAVAVVAGRRPKEKRFKLGTSLQTIDAWLKKTRKTLVAEAGHAKRSATPGTVGAAITAYLQTIVDKEAHASAVGLLGPWQAAIGAHAAARVTAMALQRVMNQWAAEGRAASTLNHRRRELAKAWDLAHPHALNPVRAVPRAKEPEREDRAQGMAVMDAILDEIPTTVPYGRHRGHANQTKARLKVMLWTGLPPATLGRLSPHQIDLERGELRLPPRKKGAGARAVSIPLFPQGVAAFRLWIAAKAQGPFSRSSARKTFTLATRHYVARMKAAGVTIALPPDLHPYDLRHSFLSWAYEQTGDPLVVQLLAQHVSLETTKRYTNKAIERRARSLIRPEALAPDLAPPEKSTTS